eukprot:Tbor_TRINITY_DN5209_c0_g3::TRINITY_DN5209_c0_g3_i1::g.16392::m.16392
MVMCLATLRTIITLSLFVGIISIPPIFLNMFFQRVIYATVVGIVSVVGGSLFIAFGVSLPMRKIAESLKEANELYVTNRIPLEVDRIAISQGEVSAIKLYNGDFSHYVVERHGGRKGTRKVNEEDTFEASSTVSCDFTEINYEPEHLGDDAGGLDGGFQKNKLTGEEAVENIARMRERIINQMTVCSIDTDLYRLQVAAKDMCEIYFSLLLQQAEEEKDNNRCHDNHSEDSYEEREGPEVVDKRDGVGDLALEAVVASLTHMEDGADHPLLEIPFYLARGKRFKGDKTTVCCYIESSKNANILVYEGIMELQTNTGLVTGPSAIDASEFLVFPPYFIFDNSRSTWREAIRMYWIDNSGRGNNEFKCDVQEVNFFEKRLAYGVKQSPIHPPHYTKNNSISSIIRTTRVSVNLILVPTKPMMLVMARCHIADSPDGTGLSQLSGVWAPALTCSINKVQCVVEKIFVKTIEPKRFWQLPSVEFVDLYGFSLENTHDVTIGELISERVR